MAQARVEAQKIERRLAQLRDEIAGAAAAYGIETSELTIPILAAPASDEDEAAHRRHVTDLEALHARVRRDLDGRVRQARSAEMLADLVTTFDPTVVVAADSGSAEPSAVSDDGVTAAERCRTATRIVGRLRGDVSAPRQARAQELAEEIVGSGPGRADGLILELRRLVQDANAEAEVADAERSEAARLRTDLFGLDDDRVAEVREQLAKVERGETKLSPALRRQVESAQEEAKVDDDRRYAAETTVTVLERLGYEVEEGFETAFVEDGTVHFQRGNWGDYVVRLRVDADQARLDFDLVRMADERESGSEADAVRDREMEASWCEAVPELVEVLAGEGLNLDIDQRPPRPGRLRTVVRDRIHLRGGAARRGRAGSRQQRQQRHD